MYGNLFDPEQIASDMRQYFEEVEATCGKAWIRNVEVTRTFESGSGRSGNMPVGKNGSGMQGGGATLDVRRGPVIHSATLGFRPACRCPGHKAVPCTVLDPFSGSGTTAMVAKNLGRHAVGIDRKAEYHEMAIKRLRQDVLPLEMLS